MAEALKDIKSEMLESIRDALYNNENIIPVVGYEMLPVIDEAGNRIPYLDYLSNKIIVERDLKEYDEQGEKVFNFSGESGFVLFNQVMHALAKKYQNSEARAAKDLSGFAISIHHLVDTVFLENIVKIRPFRYFFNLTFTTHLAEVVGRYRTFPNTAVKQSSFPFTLKTPKGPDDLIRNECRFEGIIYNVAGLAYLNNNKKFDFCYSDDDLLALIPEFSKRYGGSELKNYTEAVEESALLFLGCQYPDWLIRMLINTLKPGSLKKTSDRQSRIFFDYCQDKSNSFFLRNHEFTFQGNINTTNLVQDMFGYLSSDENTYTLGPRQNGHVFISYTRDNLDLVKRIVCELTAKNNSVWFDRTELFPGALIDNEVRQAIDSCKLFLPIITPESTNKNSNDYVRQEWIYYCERFKTQHKIIPLVYKVNLGNLGFNLADEFSIPGNVFYMNIDENGLSDQDSDYITNKI